MRSRRHPIRLTTLKNAEGSEAFWTQAKPEPVGRARRAGRANQTIEPLDVPPVWVWAGETEPPPPIWWDCGGPVRPAPRHPELDLGDGRVLVLDGTAHRGSGLDLPKANLQSLSVVKDNPGPEEDWPVYSAN